MSPCIIPTSPQVTLLHSCPLLTLSNTAGSAPNGGHDTIPGASCNWAQKTRKTISHSLSQNLPWFWASIEPLSPSETVTFYHWWRANQYSPCRSVCYLSVEISCIEDPMLIHPDTVIRLTLLHLVTQCCCRPKTWCTPVPLCGANAVWWCWLQDTSPGSTNITTGSYAWNETTLRRPGCLGASTAPLILPMRR